MDENGRLRISVGEVISSPTADYKVRALLGSGTYGVVLQCSKMATNEKVALKVTRSKASVALARHEENILTAMRAVNSDRFHIIRFNNAFSYGGHYCLDFEKLDITLHAFMKSHHYSCLQLMEIRPILQQLAAALEFLKGAAIVHADLKPENVMMVDHVWQPLRVKIIDFGLALKEPEAWRGEMHQSMWYRAPEVLLGAPFSEAIDIWSLGCIAGELVRGRPLFPYNQEVDLMWNIIQTIGMPPDHMMDVGYHTKDYFRKKSSEMGCKQWQFKTSKTQCLDSDRTAIDLKKALRDLSDDTDPYRRDLRSIVSLCSQMLMMDDYVRITPSQILQHPFITMSHLDGAFKNSQYTTFCKALMSMCLGQSGEKMWR